MIYFTCKLVEEKYSTIVLYSRDHKGLGAAHEKTSLTSLFPDDDAVLQNWLGKTKPTRSIQNAFNKLLWNLKYIYVEQNFLLTD